MAKGNENPDGYCSISIMYIILYTIYNLLSTSRLGLPTIIAVCQYASKQ